MPYIKVKRKEDDSVRNTRFKCKLCGFHIPSRTWRENHSFMYDHVTKEHKEEWKEIEKQKKQCDKELEKFNKKMDTKYQLRHRTIGSFFKSLPLPPKRMWKCPRCGEVMSPHSREYHERNADKYYIPKGGKHEKV